MTTVSSTKVQPRHLRRTAYLYVRQSSLRQVVENSESTKRQYALRQRAQALGWSDAQVVTVDSDQGESGASIAGREGFQQLVAEVGMGRAGIVMGLEVSRLARNSADWHRLLEICAVTDTLILDEDGVYDPASFNDRLLLGLKGAMSEAELHIIKARLRGGILNKARRGEFCVSLPAGLAYDDDFNVVLDPDQQVRDVVRHLFLTFRRTGSAYATLKAFHEEGLTFPRRRRGGSRHGELIFSPLTQPVVIRTLHNPRYAGAYAYGRTRSRKTAAGRLLVEKLDRGEWAALIPDAHPGYITWDEYEENRRILRENDIRHGMDGVRRTPPREGTALLQGLAVCGRCGERMSVRYHTRRGVRRPTYVCSRARVERAEPICQSIIGRVLDTAVGRLVGTTLTPVAIDVALDVQREMQARIEAADQLRLKTVHRVEYEADAARRRFMKVDPGNRLVAGTLETDWNEKLLALAHAREEYERQRAQDRLVVDGEARDRVLALATDFPRLWSDPATPNRERKRMLALVIEDITLLKSDDAITGHVRFRGGRTETLVIPRPRNGWQSVKTLPEVVAAIDRLLDQHSSIGVAAQLDALGLRPGGAHRHGNTRFTGRVVARLAVDYGLRSRYDRLREQGLLTRAEIMQRLGVSKSCLRSWAAHGIVVEHACDQRSFLYEDPGPEPPRKARGQRNAMATRGEEQQRLREARNLALERDKGVQCEA